MAEKKPKKAAPRKRGPKEQRLVIDGDWEDAIRKALKKPPKPSANR
jgi:hypothetical protein